MPSETHLSLFLFARPVNYCPEMGAVIEAFIDAH
jgi:hypothetical protein